LQPDASGHKLFFMSRMALLLCLLTIIGLSGLNSESMQSEVVLILLSNPVYPQLAKQAGVRGDVELKLAVRQDGTVESAEAVGGPAMLIQAALDSAKNSKFDCSSCTHTFTSYRLVYSFQFGPATICASPGAIDEYVKLPGYPQVTHTSNQVIVVDQPRGPLCNGGVILTPRKVRSAKCLYLWRCGYQ
jgi:Gram-negative bacterial TonB protein C-terminal